jgi:hypothetical protein
VQHWRVVLSRHYLKPYENNVIDLEYFLFIGLALLIADVALIAIMRAHGVFQEQASLDSVAFNALGLDQDLEAHHDDAYIRLELKSAGISRVKARELETALAVLSWTMNQASQIGDAKPIGAKSALTLARAGEGLDCGGMALIYDAALHAIGIRSRIVRLHSCPFSATDQHSTVEAWIDNQWIILDPTFHVSFSIEGRLCGVTDVRDSIVRNTGVYPVFHGEVAYSARLHDYYLPWSVLFNSVLIHDLNRSLLDRLTPLRYKRGPRTCYLESSGQGVGSVELVRDLYPLATIVFPIGVLFLLFGSAVL